MLSKYVESFVIQSGLTYTLLLAPIEDHGL